MCILQQSLSSTFSMLSSRIHFFHAAASTTAYQQAFLITFDVTAAEKHSYLYPAPAQRPVHQFDGMPGAAHDCGAFRRLHTKSS